MRSAAIPPTPISPGTARMPPRIRRLPTPSTTGAPRPHPMRPRPKLATGTGPSPSRSPWWARARDGVTARWAAAEALALDAGSTAADASEALFEQAGLAADTGVGAYGWFLNSITSPYTGEQLGWDGATALLLAALRRRQAVRDGCRRHRTCRRHGRHLGVLGVR